MKKTFLSVGHIDKSYAFRQFCKYGHRLHSYRFRFVQCGYEAITRGPKPRIDSDILVVLFFFPYGYWDQNIEPPQYKGVYGNKAFYLKFRDYWRVINSRMARLYPGSTVCFVNSPRNIFQDRDKERTKRILSKANVCTPRSYSTRDPAAVLKLIERGTRLYVKVRYGSMSKGITYLNCERWLTDFTFQHGKLTPQRPDYGWASRDVTNDYRFLRKLLENDIIIEEEVPPFRVDQTAFYLRVVVCYGSAINTYVRYHPVGTLLKEIRSKYGNPRMLSKVPAPTMEQCKSEAVRATNVMGLNLAGVDVMFDPITGKPVVIELNAFPGFPEKLRPPLANSLISVLGKRRWR